MPERCAEESRPRLLGERVSDGPKHRDRALLEHSREGPEPVGLCIGSSERGKKGKRPHLDDGGGFPSGVKRHSEVVMSLLGVAEAAGAGLKAEEVQFPGDKAGGMAVERIELSFKDGVLGCVWGWVRKTQREEGIKPRGMHVEWLKGAGY